MPWEISCCFLGYFSQKLRDASFCKSSIAYCPQVGWKGQRATGLSWRPRANSVRRKQQNLMLENSCPFLFPYLLFKVSSGSICLFLLHGYRQTHSTIRVLNGKVCVQVSLLGMLQITVNEDPQEQSNYEEWTKLAFPQNHGTSASRRDVKANWGCDWR